jgi:hypothetical protein
MKLGFEESQTAYTSGTQKARAWTEAWVSACGPRNFWPTPISISFVIPEAA